MTKISIFLYILSIQDNLCKISLRSKLETLHESSWIFKIFI